MQKEKKMQITRHKLTADWLSYCRLVTFTITHQRSHRPGPHLQSNRFKSSEIQVCCTLLQKFWLCCHLTVNVALGRGHYKYKAVYSDNASINRARGGDRTHQLSRFKPEGEILNQCVWQHSSNEGMCSSIQQNQCQGLLDFLLICHISVDVQRKFLTVKQALQQLTSILYSCIFFSPQRTLTNMLSLKCRSSKCECITERMKVYCTFKNRRFFLAHHPTVSLHVTRCAAETENKQMICYPVWPHLVKLFTASQMWADKKKDSISV